MAITAAITHNGGTGTTFAGKNPQHFIARAASTTTSSHTGVRWGPKKIATFAYTQATGLLVGPSGCFNDYDHTALAEIELQHGSVNSGNAQNVVIVSKVDHQTLDIGILYHVADLTNVTAYVGVNPMHDLKYSWTMEGTAPYVNLDPVHGTPIPHTIATGPNMACHWEQAGVFDVDLTIDDEGNGDTPATRTVTVTVTDFEWGVGGAERICLGLRSQGDDYSDSFNVPYSDSNDGKDFFGFNRGPGFIAAALKWNAATKTLYHDTASWYVPNINLITNEFIGVVGGTGVTAGAYRIDPNQTFDPSGRSMKLLDSLSGSDLTTGDIALSTGPKVTFNNGTIGGVRDLLGTNAPAAGRVLHVAAGYTDTVLAYAPGTKAGPYAIVKQGTGAKPVLTHTTVNNPTLDLQGTTNFRCVDISFVAGGGTSDGFLQASNQLWLRVRATGYQRTWAKGSSALSHCAFMDMYADAAIFHSMTVASGGLAIVACTLPNRLTSGSSGYAWRCFVRDSLFAYNDLSAQSSQATSSKIFGITGQTTQFNYIKNCKFAALGACFTNLDTGPDNQAASPSYDFLFEGCLFDVTGSTAGTAYNLNNRGGVRFTWRNCIFKFKTYASSLESDDPSGTHEHQRFENCTFYGGSGAGAEQIIKDNTGAPLGVGTRFVSCIMVFLGTSGKILDCPNSDIANVKDFNCVYYRPNGSGDLFTIGATSYDFTEWQAAGRGTDCVVDNPDFVDAAMGDFHLTLDSPAIDAGLEYPVTYEDFDGFMRPSGAGWDAGAFEYESGPGPGGDPDPPAASTAFSSSGVLERSTKPPDRIFAQARGSHGVALQIPRDLIFRPSLRSLINLGIGTPYHLGITTIPDHARHNPTPGRATVVQESPTGALFVPTPIGRAIDLADQKQYVVTGCVINAWTACTIVILYRKPGVSVPLLGDHLASGGGSVRALATPEGVEWYRSNPGSSLVIPVPSADYPVGSWVLVGMSWGRSTLKGWVNGLRYPIGVAMLNAASGANTNRLMIGRNLDSYNFNQIACVAVWQEDFGDATHRRIAAGRRGVSS